MLAVDAAEQSQVLASKGITELHVFRIEFQNEGIKKITVSLMMKRREGMAWPSRSTSTSSTTVNVCVRGFAVQGFASLDLLGDVNLGDAIFAGQSGDGLLENCSSLLQLLVSRR